MRLAADSSGSPAFSLGYQELRGVGWECSDDGCCDRTWRGAVGVLAGKDGSEWMEKQDRARSEDPFTALMRRGEDFG